MPLEACMIVMDTSEYMRNGDYAPNRFLAQTDAVNVIFNAKTGSNPENTVGLMTAGGASPQVLATLTQDIGKILQAISKASIGGASDLITSLNVASLALKHRENKNQRQRIVCFVGSPVAGAGAGPSKGIEDSLVKLGKKLKKNNVAVDVVVFGDEGVEVEEPLRKFVEAVGSADNSHIISVPPGAHLLSDAIASSPILAAEGGAAPPVGADGFQEFPEAMAGGGGGGGEGGGGGAGGDFGGIDPNMDPELAMAIRMSLQEAEERERRERGGADAAPAAAPAASTSASASAPAPASSSESAPLLGGGGTDDDVNMDTAPGGAAASVPAAAAAQDTEMVPADGDEDEDEDAAMLRAIAMSMEGQGGGEGSEEKKE